MFLAPKFIRPARPLIVLPDHGDFAAGDIHLPFNWVVADATALAALSVTAADVYKIAWQVDTEEIKVLTDDSPVTWATVGSGGGGAAASAFAAIPNASQALGAGVTTKINFNTESYDSGTMYNPTTSTFTAPSTGYWHFDANISAAGGGQFNSAGTLFLYKNGASIRQTGEDGSTTFHMSLSADLDLSAGDTIEVYAVSPNAVTVAATVNRSKMQWFNGHKIG